MEKYGKKVMGQYGKTLGVGEKIGVLENLDNEL